jgi:hypothetical protein
MQNSEAESDYHKRVAQDHDAHLFFHWTAGAYAWQLHGPWIGAATIVMLYAIVAFTNGAILNWNLKRDAENPLQFLRLNRWAWVILAWIVLLASGIEIVELQR